MLPGDDVIELKRRIIAVLRHQAVFAATARPLPNPLHEDSVHFCGLRRDSFLELNAKYPAGFGLENGENGARFCEGQQLLFLLR